ncbi:hypothetical protein TNCV_3149101 [Trichonephila clavipes]|nr:hypothetical protein TNCV_3149101 [Trichonephila clavipes]
MFISNLTEEVAEQVQHRHGSYPGGLERLVQPLDVCINKPFKSNLKRWWNIWMLEGEKNNCKRRPNACVEI